ncbi:unnamed protein product [Hymenolepis diminuta]|uniref:Uncharacterized protein n=1 Tax=Hymenolepis diminuta TaxID=6216 RepID=A0A564Z4S5_HYMDI|nr:unnamed protein product [Hymenolepis diminuta]
MRFLIQVSIINSLPLHTHRTQETLARQTHLPLLTPSPPILYFPLRLCTELCSIHPGLRNPWYSLHLLLVINPLQVVPPFQGHICVKIYLEIEKINHAERFVRRIT